MTTKQLETSVNISSLDAIIYTIYNKGTFTLYHLLRPKPVYIVA